MNFFIDSLLLPVSYKFIDGLNLLRNFRDTTLDYLENFGGAAIRSLR